MNGVLLNVGHSMSDVKLAVSTEQAETATKQGPSAGALLREAREAAGLHIAALAVALKVPVGKLEALESDNYSALPDTVFVRALASSVCRALKIDPLPVLALLPHGVSPKLSFNDAGLNAPVKAFSGPAFTVPFSVSRSKPLVWLVALLLMGTALMIFLPRGFDADLWAFFQRAEAEAETGSINGSTATEPLEPHKVPQAAVAGGASRASAVALSGSVVAPLPKDMGQPLPPPVALPANSISAATPSDAEAVAEVLVFKARSESWIQVRDATGAVVMQRSLIPNERVAVSGALPLAVVIGRADATEVFVRGKPYELNAVSRENVARFEVK